MKYITTKSIILSIAACLFAFQAWATEAYNFDPMHTNIIWNVDHFGFSSPSGRFGIQSGKLILDEKDMKNSSVEIVIDTANLSTGIDKFNEHIKSADFLDVVKFPTATFKSTKVEIVDKKNVKVFGNFTLHGITKPIVLDARINKIGIHPMSKKKAAGFSASTIIKRADFGIDKYVPSVANEVKISIEAEATIMSN